jgi:hypothetical protein
MKKLLAAALLLLFTPSCIFVVSDGHCDDCDDHYSHDSKSDHDSDEIHYEDKK